MAISLTILIAGVKRRSADLCLTGAGCAVLMLWFDFRFTALAAYQGAIPIHLLVACGLVVGAVFRDDAGRAIQSLGAAALLFLVAVTLCPTEATSRPPQWLLTYYPLAVAVVALAYGRLVKNPWHYAAAAGSFCCWLGAFGWDVFLQARRMIAGLDYLVCGVASFFVALVLSLAKMGVFRRLRDRWQRKE